MVNDGYIMHILRQGSDCNNCLSGRPHRNSFSTSKSKTENVLDLILSDFLRPSSTGLIGLVEIFCDVQRQFLKIFIINDRKQKCSPEKFKDSANEVENKKGRTEKCLRSDNGRKYCSREFKTYLNFKGMVY